MARAATKKPRRIQAATDAPAMRFVDFAVRAWREGPYVQVLAHATPVGAMHQPVAVKMGKFVADDYRVPLDAPLSQGAETGRELARVLFAPAGALCAYGGAARL